VLGAEIFNALNLGWGVGIKQRTSALGVSGLDSLGGSVQLKLGSKNEGKDPGGRSFNPQRRGQGHMRTSQEERRLVLASWMLSWSQWRWKSLPGQLAQNYFILFSLYNSAPPPCLFNPNLLLARGKRSSVVTVS